MAWHVTLCSIAYIDAPNKGIEQACSWRSCDIHISQLVSIHTLTLSNVNLILHKSSYSKCSLAWCQARTFLLFTIWTHSLQMREYPLQYASTDKNKKSHYKTLLKKSRIEGLQDSAHTHTRMILARRVVSFLYDAVWRKTAKHAGTFNFLHRKN